LGALFRRFFILSTCPQRRGKHRFSFLWKSGFKSPSWPIFFHIRGETDGQIWEFVHIFCGKLAGTIRRFL